MQIATCADDFLGAVLRDWVLLDPAADANEPPPAALRRWARETLQPVLAHPLPDAVATAH
jgi:flagellar biosynthesis protein FlhG